MTAPDPRAGLFFAAGFGTRMRPLTETRPKPLIAVAGTTLLDHALALGRAAGLAPMAVNVHYLADQIEAHLRGRGIAISDERAAILDTGGGLRKAAPLLGPGPVFTMNTDAVWAGPNPFETLRRAWDPARMDALLLLVPAAAAEGHAGTGDFALEAGDRLKRGGGLVYTGAQIIRPGTLDGIPDAAFSLNRAWDRIAAEGRLCGAVWPGRWCDVGRPEAIPLAEALLREAADG